jgi:DNA polymerase phi
VFGAEALLKSSVLFTSNSSFQDWKRVLDLVFDLAVKKPWLREECGWVVYSSILDLPGRVHDSSYAEAAIELLNSHQLARTPEGVAIWISTKRCFPTMKLPGNIWHREDPLNSHDTHILAKVLKEAPVADQEAIETNPKSQKGNWSPHLHFAWNVVLEEFYGVNEQPGWTHKNQKPKRMNFVDFWETVVDSKQQPKHLAAYSLLTCRR